MHIPDGYLSPQTYIPAYAAVAPFWAIASRKLSRTLKSRQTPMLALAAAFSFVIMMFNVPIPGGSTGHAVGSVLIAILLGPWSAVVAVSIALIIQALLFGDGGVTAIGANCLNMAVVMPFCGWFVYKLISGSAPASSSRHSVGAAIGGYVGLNAAALTTAFMFGIQPIIALDSNGRALYSPFGLQIAVPAMALEHLLVFGFVEAAVTGLVIAYIQRTEPSLIPVRVSGSGEAAAPQRLRTFWRRAGVWLGILVVLTPLGLWIPERLGADTAWGEWGAEELKAVAGYVPRQLARLGSIWRAPFPDYALGSGEASPAWAIGLDYIVSAVIGTAAVFLCVYGIRRFADGRNR